MNWQSAEMDIAWNCYEAEEQAKAEGNPHSCTCPTIEELKKMSEEELKQEVKTWKQKKYKSVGKR